MNEPCQTGGGDNDKMAAILREDKEIASDILQSPFDPNTADDGRKGVGMPTAWTIRSPQQNVAWNSPPGKADACGIGLGYFKLDLESFQDRIDQCGVQYRPIPGQSVDPALFIIGGAMKGDESLNIL
ncbi:MAG: hypothetical protein G8345_01725 [Magnetococcales bacterium]|nr:hypothetical protein [Magnetococcales bacterium]NGZ25589.1 hypothetical protein [Magnetococcales bacterium]